MSDFIIKIVSRPKICIVGLRVRTDMQNATRDCPKLWHEDFAPRMNEIAPCGTTESYGASWVAEPALCTFDYWAAMPLPQGKAVPEGMDTATLPAGIYAQCEIDSLEKLPAAYQNIYTNWLPGQNKYTYSTNLPSYELYPADYMQTKKIFLYFALIEK